MEFTSKSAAVQRFSQIRRGYDPAEVEAFQAAIVRALGELEAKLRQATARLDEAAAKASPSSVDEAAIHATFVEAVRTKDQMLDEAAEEARLLLMQTEDDATRLRERTEAEVAQRIEAVRLAQSEALSDVERMREQVRTDLAEYRTRTVGDIEQRHAELSTEVAAAETALAEAQHEEDRLLEAARGDTAVRREQMMLQLEAQRVKAVSAIDSEQSAHRSSLEVAATALTEKTEAETRQVRELIERARAEADEISTGAAAAAATVREQARLEAEQATASAGGESERVLAAAIAEAESMTVNARGPLFEARERVQLLLAEAKHEAESVRRAACESVAEVRVAAQHDIARDQVDILAEAESRHRIARDVVRDTRLRLEQAERTRAGVEMRAAAQAERLLNAAVADAAAARDVWQTERAALEADLADRSAGIDQEVEAAVNEARSQFDAKRADIEAGLEERAAALAEKERSIDQHRMQAEVEVAERFAAKTRVLDEVRAKDEADLAERIAEAEWQVQRAQAEADIRVENAERKAAAEVAEVHGRLEKLRTTVHRLEEQFTGAARNTMKEFSDVVGMIDAESNFAAPTGPTASAEPLVANRFDGLYMADPTVANKSRIVVDLTKGSAYVEPTDEVEDTPLPGFYEKRLAGLRERLKNAEGS